MATLAACSKAGPNATSTTTKPPPRSPYLPPTPSPIPFPITSTASGHATPQEAVTGLLNAESQGDITQACSYVVPDQQAGCPGLQDDDGLDARYPISFGQVSVDGSKAVVATLGFICGNGTCVRYTFPNADIPTSTAEFPQAYLQAASLANQGYGTFACEQVGSSWYVDLGIISGTPSPSLPASPSG